MIELNHQSLVISNKLLNTGILLFTLVFFLSGCIFTKSNRGPTVPNQVQDSESFLQQLAEQYNNKDLNGFMDHVNISYDDGRSSRSDLRNKVSTVFDNFSNIELEFYGIRSNSKSDDLTVSASWNLRWTCKTNVGDCNNQNEIALRRGRSQFRFEKQSNGYSLIGQSNILFGEIRPGDRSS